MYKYFLIFYYYITGNYENIRKIIEKSGVFYIKLGQWLAERPDIFNPNMLKELKKLQYNFPVHSDNDTILMLIKNNVNNVIIREVIGSGSIGQVHKCIYENKECVVKVKHPNIDENLKNDIKDLLYIFSWIKYFRNVFFIKKLINYCIIDIEYIVEEIVNQCDFEKEAKNIYNYSQIVKNSPYVKVPNIYYSNRDILITEYFKGEHIDQYILKNPEKKNKICLRLLAHYYKTVFIDNIVHGDIHSGNIIIDENDNINLVDFGIVINNKDKLLFNFFKNNREPKIYLPIISVNYVNKYNFEFDFDKNNLPQDFKNAFMKFLFKNGIVLKSDFTIMLNNLDTIMNYNDKDYRKEFKEMVLKDEYFKKYLGFYVLFM